MQSRCPHSHRGAYPAFQHWSDGALTSPQDNSVTSVPVVHPAHRIQDNMIATQNPGQWQQGNTQSQQSFQGLQHRLEFEQFENLNNNTGLQQRQHLKCAFSVGTSSAAHQGNTLGAAAQSLQDQQGPYPLLRALLQVTPSSSSKETNSNIELNISNHFSDERRCKNQQVKSSLATLNCGQTRIHNLGDPGEPYQQQVLSPSVNSQPFSDDLGATGEMIPPTDDQIHDFLAKSVAYYRALLPLKNRNCGHIPSNRGWNSSTNDSILRSDCIMPKSNSVSHLPTTSASHKGDVEGYTVIERCTAAVGQALEEDSSKGSKENAELTAKYKETRECAESTPEKHSTGTQVSAVRNSNHASENETVEKSASVDFDLPVTKHLDVTVFKW